ncbi:hypothetical protein EDC04DRAFT_1138420 [Pisolithus marmoratus]|nr:hypothetical protein EDC04DRAFT_1138420 [Pisolithus marmoratus]
MPFSPCMVGSDRTFVTHLCGLSNLAWLRPVSPTWFLLIRISNSSCSCSTVACNGGIHPTSLYICEQRNGAHPTNLRTLKSVGLLKLSNCFPSERRNGSTSIDKPVGRPSMGEATTKSISLSGKRLPGLGSSLILLPSTNCQIHANGIRGRYNSMVRAFGSSLDRVLCLRSSDICQFSFMNRSANAKHAHPSLSRLEAQRRKPEPKGAERTVPVQL